MKSKLIDQRRRLPFNATGARGKMFQTQKIGFYDKILFEDYDYI